MTVRTISAKLTPKKIPPTIQNNYVDSDLQIVYQIKKILVLETSLGINRIFLLEVSNLKYLAIKLYSCLLLCFSIYFTIYSTDMGTTHFVLKYLLLVEYAALVILVLTTAKAKLVKFFKNLQELDTILKIQNCLDQTSSSKMILLSVILCILVRFCEYYLEMKIYKESIVDLSHVCVLIESLVHDFEQIFFYTLLRFTYLRLLIVKSHIARTFNFDEDKVYHRNKVEDLASKANLDISSLHRVYELLHRCSCELNAVMGVPMLIIFFSSGISTIMLLKIFVNIFQLDNDANTNTTIIYLALRCVKYTLLLIVPCYYSSVTNTQAATIRTTLHDSVNSMRLNKSDRRKVKTFFQLTRESDFSYALCGVIKLDMTLPLSYMSLCTTYLVIIIQFSKFID